MTPPMTSTVGPWRPSRSKSRTEPAAPYRGLYDPKISWPKPEDLIAQAHIGQGSSVTTKAMFLASLLSRFRLTSPITRSSAWAVAQSLSITAFLEDEIVEPDESKMTAPIGRSLDEPNEATSNARCIISSGDLDTLELYLFPEGHIK